MDVRSWSYGANHVIGSFSKYINGEMKGDHNLLHVNIAYFLAKKKKTFSDIENQYCISWQ